MILTLLKSTGQPLCAVTLTRLCLASSHDQEAAYILFKIGYYLNPHSDNASLFIKESLVAPHVF